MTAVSVSPCEGIIFDSTMRQYIAQNALPCGFRRRGGVITIFCDSALKQKETVRFTRVTKQWWVCELRHGSRWESLPMRNSLQDSLDFIHKNFSWYLGIEP